MGSSLSVEYSDLVPGMPIKDTLDNGHNRYYGFTITKQHIDSGLDIVIKLRVQSGYFSGLTLAMDENFPSSRRPIWQQEFYCLCPSPTCDYVYPQCLNQHGGLCTSCMFHDDTYTRISHDYKLGGLGASNKFNELQVNSKGIVAPRSIKPGAEKIDHSGSQFAIRLDLSSPQVKPGHYFVTVQTLLIKHTAQKPAVQAVGIIEARNNPPSVNQISSNNNLGGYYNHPGTASANPESVHNPNDSTNHETKSGLVQLGKIQNNYVIGLELRKRKTDPQVGNDDSNPDLLDLNSPNNFNNTGNTNPNNNLNNNDNRNFSSSQPVTFSVDQHGFEQKINYGGEIL
jgi:hypothetical protein